MKGRAQSAGRVGPRTILTGDFSSPSSARPPSAFAKSSGFHDRYSLTNLSPKSDKSFSNDALDAKMSRKRAESDLQLLANRIALLKLEEQKALVKVNETQIRANEILEVKKRNHEMLELKLRRSQQREREIQAIQMKAAAERRERQERLDSTRENFVETKRAVASSQKQESRYLQEVAYTGKALTEAEKRKKAEEEKKRKESLRRRREREQREHERQLAEKAAQKVEEEARKRREAEDMIRLLEEEEQKLVSRLQRTQSMQREAYSLLQRSLQS